MAEMQRVGVEAARVEDIVAAAGVGWGSFYRYFHNKGDVLLDAAASVAQVFVEACEVGVETGRPASEVIAGAFWRAASSAPAAPPLWEATFRSLTEKPQRLSELLADRNVSQPVDVLAELIDGAQRRGEMRSDHPSQFLAHVVLTAVWANALLEGPVGVTSSRLPPPGRGVRTSRRSLTVTLLVDGLRKEGETALSEDMTVPMPNRIGRKRSPGTGSPPRA